MSTLSTSTTALAPPTTLREAEPLVLTAATPPAGLESVDTFYDAIPYDTFEATVLDLALPTADTPRALVIYIHGGGFVEGGRERAYEPTKVSEANAYLAEGFAFASVDYRLLDEPTAAGILTSFNDSRRAVQFLRAHAAQLGIDPDRVLLTGGSAGAGMSLWIALSDDASEPGHANPVRRESTRVSGVVAFETQATYDILRWGPDIFENDEVDVVAEAAAFEYLDVFLSYYGIDDPADLTTPAAKSYRRDVDLLALIDAGDPPFWARNEAQPADPPWKPAYLLHAPQHLVALQRQADLVSVESVLYAPQLGIADASGETFIEFARRLLAD